MKSGLNLELVKSILEDIDTATRRSPLLVGFAHGPASYKEIKDRLDEISELVKEALNHLQ